MTLNLVFVETALELVPEEIVRHPSVRRNAKRRGKRAEETLLDRSLHHYAMGKLQDQERRGRPDIIHFCLLEAMGSPLNRSGRLRVWVSTRHGYTVEVDPSTRPPRDRNRFDSLMEQLFLDGRSPPKGGEPLLTLRRQTLTELIKQLNPDKVVALTSHGEQGSFEGVAGELCGLGTPAVMVGAYPAGPLSVGTLALADLKVSVYPESLETWTVVSRLLHACELELGLL
ncbi:16S rRNA methyltransferase [Candidatus Bathyarchaeota archaeon]|nr:16S rRNA methyltransferase [Candidatus Bathyarchaeota archaeon]